MITLVRIFFLLATHALLALASLNLIKTGDECLFIDAIFPSNTSIIYTGPCADGRWPRWQFSEGRNQSIQLFGTNICLSAYNDRSGQNAGLANCSEIALQKFWMTDEGQITLEGTDICLTDWSNHIMFIERDKLDFEPDASRISQKWDIVFLTEEKDLDPLAAAASGLPWAASIVEGYLPLQTGVSPPEEGIDSGTTSSVAFTPFNALLGLMLGLAVLV